MRKDLEQSHQQLQAAQQALSKAQGEAKAAAASAAAAEEASASQQTKLQVQLVMSWPARITQQGGPADSIIGSRENAHIMQQGMLLVRRPTHAEGWSTTWTS